MFLLGEEIKYFPTDPKKENLVLRGIKEWLSCMKRFTYTKQIKYDKRIINDIGWGCTVRSGQMLLFGILFFKIGEKGEQSFVEKVAKSSQLLRSLFSDKSDKIFSFSRIMKRGQDDLEKKLGSYWNAKEFFMAVEREISYCQHTIQVCGVSLKLKLIISDDGGFDIDEIRDSIEKGYFVLLILNCMIEKGCDKKMCEKSVLSALCWKEFSGMICGKGKEAYYACGELNSSILFIDPHKVQEHTYEECYDVNYLYRMCLEETNASTTLTFLLQNKEDLDRFESRINSNKHSLIYAKKKQRKDTLSEDECLIYEFNKNPQDPHQHVENKTNHGFEMVEEEGRTLESLTGFIDIEDDIPEEEADTSTEHTVKVLNCKSDIQVKELMNDNYLFFSTDEQDRNPITDWSSLTKCDSFMVINEQTKPDDDPDGFRNI